MQQYQCIKQPRNFDDINFERRIFDKLDTEYFYLTSNPPIEKTYVNMYCNELDYYIRIEENEFEKCFVKYPYETNVQKEEVKMTKIQRHKELCEQLNKTYEEKNKNYGDSFGISVKKYGYISALTRMSDKWNRLETLILNRLDGTKDESLSDTLTDLANYCLMTVMELEEEAKHDSMWKQEATIGTCEDMEDLFKQSVTLND